jgi:two-component system nitrate/nitrite response regulator NarL
VIVLTVSDAPDDVLQAIRAGADGYLLKDSEPEVLLAQIEQALQGTLTVSDALASRLAHALRDEAQAKARTPGDLTDREREILRGLAQGLSNKMIARELDISEGTVKVHVKNVLRKLKMKSRVEAAVWAAQLAD